MIWRKIKWCKSGVNKQKSTVKTIENNTLLIKICPKTRQVNASFKNKFLTNNVFTSIKMITDGNPGHKTESVLTWMYYKAFSTGEFGYSAALSFIIAVVLGILAVVQFRMMDHSKLD